MLFTISLLFMNVYQLRKSPHFILNRAIHFWHPVKNFFFDFLLFAVFFFLIKGQKAVIITTFKNSACKIIQLPWTSLKFLIFMCYCQTYFKRSVHKVAWGQCFSANWTAGSSMWLPFCVCECVSNVYPPECLVARTPVPMNSICY